MAYKLIDHITGEPIKRDGKEVFGSDFLLLSKAVNMEKRTLSITGSDETVDRDGDIIEVKGWDLSNYLKNPVFLWAHDYSSVPLAAAYKVAKKKGPNRLAFDFRFPTLGLYPFADMILGLYGEGIINASSVGFIPFEYKELEEADMANAGPRRRRGYRYSKQELLELSGCAVPCNPAALQNAFKSLKVPEPEELMAVLEGRKSLYIPETKDDILGELDVRQIEFTDETESRVHQVPEHIGPAKTEDDFSTISIVCNNCGETIEIIPAEDTFPEKINCPLCGVETGTENQSCGLVSLDCLPEGTKWDEAVAMDSLRKWASSDGSGEEGKIDWAKYRNGFCWVDSSSKENFAGYKMPFAMVVDGSPKAVWKGVTAAMTALLGGRGGVNLPDSDRQTVYNFLKSYYKKFDKEVPDFKTVWEILNYVLDLNDTATSILEQMVIDNKLLEEFTTGKVGAVLNRKNKDRLKTAAQNINDVLAEAESQQESQSTSGVADPADPAQRSQASTGEDVYDQILNPQKADPPPVKPAKEESGLSAEETAGLISVLNILKQNLISR